MGFLWVNPHYVWTSALEHALCVSVYIFAHVCMREKAIGGHVSSDLLCHDKASALMWIINQTHVPRDGLCTKLDHKTSDDLIKTSKLRTYSCFWSFFFLEALLSIWRANGKADMSQWLLWQAVVDTITRHSTMKEQLLFFLCILFNHCHKFLHMHRNSQNSSMYECWSQRSLWQRLAVSQRKPLTPHQTEVKSCFDCLHAEGEKKICYVFCTRLMRNTQLFPV